VSSCWAVRVSLSAGTLSRVTASGVSRLAHRAGSAAFLAPDTDSSPASACPPWMRSLSIRLRLVFVGRQGAHGQCVDLGVHAVAQRGIDELVPGDAAFAFEGRADDDGFEVGTVASDGDVIAGQVVGNVL